MCGAMAQQEVYLPPLLLVAAILSIFVPLCTSNVCLPESTRTKQLYIVEDFGVNAIDSIPSQDIIDFEIEHQGLGPPLLTDHDFSGNERLFNNHFQWSDSGARARLSTKGWIDREVIATLLLDTFNPVKFMFDILLYNGSFLLYGCINVTLHVIDLDDNTPTFDDEMRTVEFYDDNELVGDERFIPTADDHDEGRNGTYVYELDDPSGKFELVLNNYTNTMRVQSIFLRNTSPLDHEQQESYNLVLYAREANDDPDEDMLNIQVVVKDLCDEPPMFTTSRYTPSISEDASVNHLIATVEATDADDRTQCPLEYTITKVCGRVTKGPDSVCQTVFDSEPFILDSESGRLTLREELDREERAEYEVTVQATDSVQSSATATVVISIDDINDNDPQVSSNIFDSIHEYQMADPDRSIGHFTVSDADADRNGQVFVFLLDNSSGVALESQTFRLTTQNKILYQIVLNRSLDYETQREFSLVIQVRDNGTQPRFSNYPVMITIIDFNDHSPVFINLPMGVSIQENSVLNTAVTSVKATDRDSGINAVITYELPDSTADYPHQHLFQIEPEIGEITVGNGELDYELFTNCTILVLAVNSESSDPLSNSTELKIRLENINDNEPEITAPTDIIEVMENAQNGEILGQVIATDADNLEPLSYSLASYSSLFSISGDGVLSLEGELDYETMTSYSVSVDVSDSQYTTSADITIDVIPVNDEFPRFTQSGPYVATVTEEEPEETFVLHVTATDRDNPPQDLRFSIVQGLHRDRFSINSMGEIYTTETLDRETTPNYTLGIQVSDGELSSDVREVTIIVIDINDHTPHFINQPYNFAIEEHNMLVQVVGTVEVVSLDKDDNQVVRFEIPTGSGNDWFMIGESTGVIETNRVLDHETDVPPNPIELTVIVRDMGSPQRINSTIVHVTIVDINDNGPTLTKDNYEFILREDHPIGRVFGAIVANDADGIGNNITKYSFSEETDASAFHIEELTGELSLVSSLDYETTNLTMFDVIATDEGRRDLQIVTTVTIIITNARDLNLTFPSDFSPHFSVTENVEENFTITSLEVKDNAMNSVNRLTYKLTTLDDMPSPYFGVRKEDNNVAYIYTRTHTIDREAADLGDDKVYRLKLNVSDPDMTPDTYGYIVSYINIEILDENDNEPRFIDASNDFYVLENGMAGELVARFQVMDPDAGNNGTIFLGLDSVVPFNVTHVEYNNGQQFAYIRVVSPLDRELRSMYQFFLRASDQGTPTNSHTMIEINVHVMDVNDNSPRFCQDQQGDDSCTLTFSVREDHAISQAIAIVDATDPDDGTNAEIRYEFVPGHLVGSSRFTLEPNTGRIILGESLDRETVPEYEFEVRAVDGGDRASTATVLLKITDVNEYPPAFLNTSFTTTIPENIATGVPFSSLVAVDQDDAPKANVKYALADASLSRIFDLNEETGQISIHHKEHACDVIDYERLNEYKVGIIAYDQGTPRRYSNKTLTVQITDVNEHTPLFDVSELHIIVSENAEVGSTVLEIRAYDLDTADSLQYSLTPGSPFVWDGENNAILLGSTIEYNPNNPIIMAQLHVTDGERHSNIAITALVLNENNHQPVFETLDSTVSVSENADIGNIIFAVHASDADNATNDAVTYSISAGNVDNAFFLNPKAGVLHIAQDLDYETETSYDLTIVATDTGDLPLTSEPIFLTVEIINENDEVPTFEKGEYTFTLFENNAEMAEVGCVQAPDDDEGEFGVVVYSIVDEGENPGFFTIHKNTGCIMAIQTIDRETNSEFQLSVQAQDNANPALTDTVVVNVAISDHNDNEPSFTQPHFLFYITPDHSISEPVGIITASDGDSDENASFDFEIVSQNPNLEVSLLEDGEVRLVAAIPSNYAASYSIPVRVSSSVAGDTATNDANVIIVIESDTEHHPRFTLRLYEEHVSESASVGYNIFDAFEVISDQDGTDGLTFTLAQDYEKFALDSETGLLTLQASLNYEDVRSYEIQIQATDTSSRTASATLKIEVEDGNDHAPVFIEPPTNFVLSPIPYMDIELFTVLAKDDDIGDQGTVGYSIVQSSSTFQIDSETGVVTNRVILITNDIYEFVIRAFDHGSPLMSSNITVRVRIDDSEDSPQFTNGDTSIGITVPEDKDITIDPVIREFSTQPVAESYHLVYSNASKNMFAFDTANQLVLNSQLDYERASQYLLIIEARSISNGMRLSSFLLVNIIVTDINDNAPYFLSPQKQDVSESTPPDTILFRVIAEDDDSDQNAHITYVISDGNIGNAFEIDPTSGSVRLVEPLDRETTSSYNLTIRAIDGAMINQMIICVKVTDVNDNPPVFSRANYSIAVFEHPHTVMGDSIIQIVAADADVGSVNYYLQLLEGSFMNRPRNPSSDTFSIDFDTGNITARRDLDREEIDSYFIRIEARDTNQEHSAFAYLTVMVNDVNDHAPAFPSGRRDITIHELMPENSLVLDREQVTDRDIGQNSLVKYSLGDNWPDGHFRIDPWSGVIRVNTPFEFDSNRIEFDGTVLAIDQGVPPRTGTMTVRVSIQDVNNYPPVLDDTHFSLSISFDHSLDTPITEFSYSDMGDSLYNTVTSIRIPNYYIDALSLFEMSTNDEAGIMKLRREPTVTDIGEHHFRIEAIEQTSLPFCPQYIQATYAFVTVTIHPTNSHSPMFSSPQITHNVPESLEPGSELREIDDFFATDADGDNIFYSLLTNNVPFAIQDPSSPIITTTGNLDADSVTSSNYQLTVQAKDDGFPVRSSNATLTIHVLNVNDVGPTFEHESYSEEIAENSEMGTTVLGVFAEDSDSDIIYYSIEHSEDCDSDCLPFGIDSSGYIIVSKPIDFEDKQSYQFRVTASDGDHTSHVSLTIDVVGENEHAPTFERKLFEFSVTEDQPDRSLVGRVRAVDLDAGYEGQLIYSFTDEIEPQYNVFTLNETSGEIFIDVSMSDRADVTNSERKRSVEVVGNDVTITRTVMVQDSGDAPMSDNADVVITVNKGFFEGISGTPPEDTAADDPPFQIIIIVVIAVVGAIVAFVAVIVIALLCRRHARNRKIIVGVAQMNGASTSGMEMTPGRYFPNENGTTSLDTKTTTITTTTKLQTGNSASGSERSYTGTADDEMDSGNERYNGHLPNIPNKPERHSSSHVRSTSDLASSVGTEALQSQANKHPYTKAQLIRIYRDNQELLDDNISHDSVHMFGSEGGGEADGDLDINNLIFQKIHDLEDDEESTTVMDDDASTTYSKGRGTVLTGSADILPVDDREDPLNYPDVRKGWIPPTGRPMDEAIDEITATSSFASQEEPLPRRHGYDMGVYSHSQGASLYNPSATQESYIGIPKPYHNTPKMHDYSHRYYHPEDHRERLARERAERDRPRYTNHRYGSASVLQSTPDYHHRPGQHRQHYRSQDLAPPYAKYSPFIPGTRGRPVGHHHNAYTTPSEGTEGTVTPQTALTNDYQYLSSSSTSLTSTNVSGNLSQPSRQPPMYN